MDDLISTEEIWELEQSLFAQHQPKIKPAPTNPFDHQHGGNHYQKLGDYQPYKVLEKWLTPEELRGFAKGSAIVYLARERDKGGDDDLKKAQHFIELYFAVIGKATQTNPPATPSAAQAEVVSA